MRSKNILLVDPSSYRDYYSPYPPLGLLKIAAYQKQKGNQVYLVKGISETYPAPDKIYLTSLFTYSYEPVHRLIDFYSAKHKNIDIVVGGIYATLCKEHLADKYRDRITIHEGIFLPAEGLLPDYSLVPEWKSSIVFSSRGCIRKCRFCSVSRLEPKFQAKKSIKKLVFPGHDKIVFWDNNILASPFWENIFDELEELSLKVDFNQGLDARLIDSIVIGKLLKLKIPIVRLAYDSTHIRKSLYAAIEKLKDAGFRSRNIIVYCLYNFDDSPEEFFIKIRDLMSWSVTAYPMRFQPLSASPKNTFISKKWTEKELEMIADARRVIGYGGAFPPYDGLRKKILRARNFGEAFRLRAVRKL